jgi:hypothetical protein
MYAFAMTIERLTQLQREYEDTLRDLRFPLSALELHQLQGRREDILGEARTLGDSLSLVDGQWFSKETL